MPGRGFAFEGLFGDEMAAPQADIGAGQRLDEIQNFIGKQKFKQPRIPKVHGVEILLAIFFEIFFKNGLKARELVGCKNRLVEERVAVSLVLGDLVG